MSGGGRITGSVGVPIEDVFCSDFEDLFVSRIALEQLNQIGLNIRYVVKETERVGGNLAGGCLRDLVLGKQDIIKDMDIFYATTDKTTVLPSLETAKFGKCFLVPDNAVRNSMRDEVVGVIKYQSRIGVDIVLVDRKDIREIVQTFDASICQIWVEKAKATGDFYIMCSHDFLRYLYGGIWYRYVDVKTSAHLDRVIAKYGPYKEKTRGQMKVCRLGKLDTYLARFCNKQGGRF